MKYTPFITPILHIPLFPLISMYLYIYMTIYIYICKIFCRAYGMTTNVILEGRYREEAVMRPEGLGVLLGMRDFSQKLGSRGFAV